MCREHAEQLRKLIEDNPDCNMFWAPCPDLAESENATHMLVKWQGIITTSTDAYTVVEA